jgi:hypothetical protein
MNVIQICVLPLEQNLHTCMVCILFTSSTSNGKNTKYKYLTLYLRQVLCERLNLADRFNNKNYLPSCLLKTESSMQMTYLK